MCTVQDIFTAVQNNLKDGIIKYVNVIYDIFNIWKLTKTLSYEIAKKKRNYSKMT